MGCCECHDHKFDPFTTRDFYRLAAFFADVKQWGVYADYGYTPNPDLKGFTNDHPFPPEIEVDQPVPPAPARAAASNRSKQVVSMSAAKLTEDGEAARGVRRLAARPASTSSRHAPDGWVDTPGRRWREGKADDGVAVQDGRKPAARPARPKKGDERRFRLDARAGLAGRAPARGAPTRRTQGLDHSATAPRAP